MFIRSSTILLLVCILTTLTHAASTKRTQTKNVVNKKSKIGATTSRPTLSTLKQALAEARTPQDPTASSSSTTLAPTTVPSTTVSVVETVEMTTLSVDLMQPFFDCHQDNVGYEIVTGYVFSAPKYLISSIPETLMLSDCLDACSLNYNCTAINFETGLCVLFSSNSDETKGALMKSQFPVFTIYAQKTCFSLSPCDKPWCVDRLRNYKLNGYVKRTAQAMSRIDCYEMCLGENDFMCRSANYYAGTCELSDMDRTTLSGTTNTANSFEQMEGADYLENNCLEEPKKLCEFKRLSGKILKTVDSVYMEVSTIEECRDLCLNSPYKCRSYDYQETGALICRLSHHNEATLFDIDAPYLDVPEASSYELSACYNVSIECKASEMVAKIQTSKLFSGKIYAKGAPNSCAVDATNDMNMELRMGYNNLECNVKQNGQGLYLTDVIIQHHDMVITSSDLGLAVTCQYDLTNITVNNNVDLGIQGDLEPSLHEDVVVDAPNVYMKISQRNGNDLLESALVGDPLALRFEILDSNSPYEISIRELVAMDGADSGEITLIDSRGCPTDYFIMGPVFKSYANQKTLVTNFDAFKFPSSDIVQFRALVTPCMPSCEPVICDGDDSNGDTRTTSYGRKRRSTNDTEARHQRSMNRLVSDDLLLTQSIYITDKFGFDESKMQKSTNNTETPFIVANYQDVCINSYGIVLITCVFLLAQLSIIAVWKYLFQRRRKEINCSQQFNGHVFK